MGYFEKQNNYEALSLLLNFIYRLNFNHFYLFELLWNFFEVWITVGHISFSDTPHGSRTIAVFVQMTGVELKLRVVQSDEKR